MRLMLKGLTVLMLLTSAAAAEENNACYDRAPEGQIPNTYFNAQSTSTWRGLLQQADTELMGQMAGVYYGEINSPDGQFVSHQYRSFEANGLYQYRDQTCGNIAGLPCSENQGTGEWRAVAQQDGTIYMMARFSDLVLTSACSGARVQFNGGAMMDEFGIYWQRVQ